MDKEQISRLFPLFTEIELKEELSEFGIERHYKSGEFVIRKGQYMKYIPLILSGSVKVMREDANGNEMFLYYLEGGNTCAMSIVCCMKEEKSKVWAVAEEDTEILLVETQHAETWMKKYSSWRNFVISSYATRMDDLLYAFDSVAFDSLDQRLLKYLHNKSNTLKTEELSITHGDIAKELNTSREAISRLLKKLENMGKVKLGRNKLRLLEKELEV